MAFQLSPGVNVSEIDLTNVVPAVGTSIGAFAGDFAWGPANKIVLVDSENNLATQFGKPTDQNFTSFFSASNFLAYTNNLKLVRTIASNTINASADGSGKLIANEDDYELTYYGVTTSQSNGGTFVARYAGDLGNSLAVSMCANTNSFGYSGFTANTTIGSNIITCSSNTVGLYANTGDLITVSGTSYTIASVTNQNVTIVGTATANANAGIATTSWAYASLFDSAPGTTTFATNVGGSNDEIHLVVIDENGKFTGTANTPLEVFPHVSKASDAKTDDGSPNYYVTILKNKSKYVYATGHITGASNWGNTASGTSFTNSIKNYTVALSGGLYSVPSAANTVSGFNLFSDPDQVDISLLISGAADATVADAVLTIANSRKDVVAFVSPLFADAVSTPSSSAIIAYRNTLTPSTSYSVMDSGWKYQFDKYNNKYRFVPLNADIAGLCARTDNVRDPWYSPAGLNRGQILNAIKLSWNPTKAQRDDLYKAGVNPVVSFPGEGIVLYGDKTMQIKPSAFDRINVRRLFIVLEKAISTAAKYSLFEFNDNFTRAQFVALVAPFLRDVKGRRGIYDYKVICDESNNTPEVIDSNRFVGDIYIKPSKSINYIQLNFVAVRTGVSFTEVAGSF